MDLREQAYTIFNSEGKLLQVEYGLEAVYSSNSIVSVKGRDSIACVSKKVIYPPLCTEEHTSIFKVADGLYVNITGLAQDVAYVVSKMRSLASSLEYELDAPLTPDVFAGAVADKFQIMIQRTGTRMPAFSALVCGFDGDATSIYYTDMSAVEYPCASAAAGANSSKITKFLEKHLDVENKGGEEAMELAMTALLQGIGKNAEFNEIQACSITKDGVSYLSDQSIEKMLLKIAEGE